ncbi:hypothetical protein [Deinococcus depolymerans]|uniref:DUF8082 domain-containing protein n=1 Tax=Deinococcus depolymerans TaxID=392408 RepID=A0ABN1C517_9DEIO
MSAPQWPDGLSDSTPLPYTIWRVLHQVDGVRDITEVARLAGLTVPDVNERLNAAAQWINRAAQREQQVTDQTATMVTQCLMPIIGPMAEVMVDEVLDDLGAQATLSALLSGLARQLTPERVQQFARNLRDRGIT